MAEELKSWNLMTRANSQFEFINWRLTLFWAAGFWFRYCLLLPARLTILLIGVCLYFYCSRSTSGSHLTYSDFLVDGSDGGVVRGAELGAEHAPPQLALLPRRAHGLPLLQPQVSCDWWRAGHVTQCSHCACAASPPASSSTTARICPTRTASAWPTTPRP